MSCSVPCPTCPWRVGSAGGAAIPNFDIGLARRLANTVGPDDGFRPIMACHGSADGGERACVGYVATVGWTNLAVRVAAIDGRIDLNAIDDACADLDLYPTFEQMLAALEEAE